MTLNARKLFVLGLFVGANAVSVAQSAGGGTPVWTKVIDSDYGIVQVSVPFNTTIDPNTFAYHRFHEHYKVWETLNEDTTLTAPWTSPFSALLDWPDVLTDNIGATSNQYGQITWIATMDDCLDEGTPAVQKWLYNPTSKNQERKNGYKALHKEGGGMGA